MTSDRTIHLTRRIEAHPQTVFSILSEPEGMSAWLEGEATFDASPGSEFVVRFPQYATVIAGEIVEVRAPELLVVTWGVAEGPQSEWFLPGSSTVRIELEPDGDGTLVHLTHEDLPTEAEIPQHEGGWRFHLSRLQLRANRLDLAGRLPAIWEAWYAAWKEPDEAERLRLLRTACHEDVGYDDDYAALRGIEMLSLHIANSLRFMPGWTVSRSGDWDVCRGQVLVPWETTGPEGQPGPAGRMYARVTPDGRIQHGTSFWTQDARPADQAGR